MLLARTQTLEEVRGSLTPTSEHNARFVYLTALSFKELREHFSLLTISKDMPR